MTLHPEYRLIGHSLYRVTPSGSLKHLVNLPQHIDSLSKAIGYYESQSEGEDDE